MSAEEIMWYTLTALSAIAMFVLIGAIVVSLPLRVERQHRRDEVVDRNFEARRAQFPEGALDAAVAVKLAEGRLTPKMVQRFTARGWL